MYEQSKQNKRIVQSKMKVKERENRILEILRVMQRVVMIDELSELLNVSKITVRRDLQVLENKRTIIRTHGGCMLAGRLGMETQYRKKVVTNFNLKQNIGKRAAQEIRDGEKILIDDGSTAFHLLANLNRFKSLSVYTNSLAIISELNHFPSINFYLFGGVVNEEHYSVGGYLTQLTIEQIKFDKVFLGVSAIDNNGICFANSESSARLTQIMLRNSKERILLCDQTKVGKDAYYSFATLDDFDIWITTPIPISNEHLLKEFQRKTKLIMV